MDSDRSFLWWMCFLLLMLGIGLCLLIGGAACYMPIQAGAPQPF